ncbi:MAG: hypothetical protein NT057_01230 [Actinobacteria bacterium]|nr:hypothetical protein [Actinomycetota bacterium]
MFINTSPKKIVAVLAASLLIPIFILPTSTFSAGRTAASVANTLLNGKGVPAASLGINGDFYIDKTAMNLYGPKALGKWPLPVSMRGAVGPMGPVGVDGKAGERGVASTSSTGVAGSKGETGAIGPVGPTGAAGSSGAGGAGPAGANGDQGLQGNKGDQGIPGVVGETGTVGAQGATGPSEVVVFKIAGPGGIDPWTFSSSGGSPESISSDFGNLQAGKSYRFTIVLTGYVNSTGWFGLAVGSLLRCTGGTSTINSTVGYSEGKVLLPGALKRYQFTYLYEGTVIAGPSGNNLNVSVIDGESWSNGFLLSGFKIVGTAYIQLIGGVLPNWSG